MKTLDVSVVIPTFNRAQIVGAAIQSVLAQTCKNFEVIVVDDGSTDNTEVELARFGDRIRYIHQKNMGVSAARNTGIRAARGKWIAFLDSDDCWRPTKLERQFQCLEKLNVSMCFTKCVSNLGEVLPDVDTHTLIPRGSGMYYGATASDLLCQKTCPWLPSLIVEKRLLEKVGLFDESLHAAEDTRIMHQLAFVAGFAYLDEPLVIIRQGSPGSLTHEMISEAGRKRLDCYVRVQTEAYWRIMEVDRKNAGKARRVLGYFVSRRAEVACAEGEFKVARSYARDGLFLARDLRSFLRCIGIYTFPRLCRTRFLKKWSPDNGKIKELEKTTGKKQLEITYVTSELPYPLSHGGLMAAHNAIQALAKRASVSIVVMTPGNCSEAIISEAEDYYLKTCRSFVCHQFPHLNPSSSNLIKAWHYLTGYPRHGFWSKEADRILAEQMQKTGCEVLWCNSTYEVKYLPTAKKMKCKTVLMTHNVESDLIRQEMAATVGKRSFVGWIRHMDMRRLEKMGARYADLVTGITNVDYEYYVRLKGADRTFLLPFGYRVNENGPHPEQSREDPCTICFIGSMDWLPNVVAARYLVNEIMPLVWKTIPEAKCLLVGKNPTEEVRVLASEKVTVTGTVPSVREYYERASVIVVPVQEVSGVKIKLIEAMAVGKAVVTTSAGATGIKVEDGTQVLVANDPKEFATAVIDLVKNKGERQRLGKEARRFVNEHLSPKETEIQVQKILHALNQL